MFGVQRAQSIECSVFKVVRGLNFRGRSQGGERIEFSRAFSRCFQGVFKVFSRCSQGVFKVFSRTFSKYFQGFPRDFRGYSHLQDKVSFSANPSQGRLKDI
jgi:hypothetical protein